MKASTVSTGKGDTMTELTDAGHERVSLPSDDSLWAAGVDHATKRAQVTNKPVDQPPLYIDWIVQKGQVLADLRGVAWSRAHRDELSRVAKTTAATSTASATQAETTSAAREHQAELDELHTAARPASSGLPFMPRLPKVAYALFLAGVALGETAFNVTAFRITGEKEWFVGIMATLVGIASAMSAHLIGGPLEEITTTERERRGRIFVRLGMGLLLAVVMIAGLVAVASLRSDYLDVAQAGSSESTTATDTIFAGNGGASTLPQIGLLAPLALNLMVWVVAIGAAYNHACVHHSADAKMRKHYRRTVRTNRKARTRQANAMAEQIGGYEHVADATRAALADLASLIDLVKAKTVLYAAAYCSVLDQHGIEHFTSDAIPELPKPSWATEAEKLLAAYESGRDKQLNHLNTSFVSTTAAPLATRTAASSPALTSTPTSSSRSSGATPIRPGSDGTAA